MLILPLAFDSFGVRSMATFVKTKDVSILIDGAAALGPRRYGLSPTKEEFDALEICKKNIIEIGKLADVLIVTHYHYDHHPYPWDEDLYSIYKRKTILAKSINEEINQSGKTRGKIFENKIKRYSKIEYADGKSFEFGNTFISFSKAVWHGDVGSKVGKVIMVHIEEGKDSILFGSDAQSLADEEALKFVKEKNPKLLIVDGYPTIFVGWKMQEKSFLNAKENLKEAIRDTDAEKIILDHHVVRDINYKDKMMDIFELGKSMKKEILTAAEFLGLENFFLEAWRKEIKEGKRIVNVEEYFKRLNEKIKEKMKE
ncbi:MAG: MBL fold metallo-hydrolase [Candidatus Aenigmarchaeota archaeon]|nr:MBL fold metallo-hydrolase [Candidatus Aenigmarchaeota archaeon]